MRNRTVIWVGSLLALGACEHMAEQGGPSSEGHTAQVPTDEAKAPGKKTVVAPLEAEKAPPASARVATDTPIDDLTKKIATYFEGNVGRRIYIQVDKPLYKPGETIWIKTWDLKARDLTGAERNNGFRYELVSPKGAVVLRKNVQATAGTATNDFIVPAGVQGGEYKLRVVTYDGQTEERPVIVSTYEPPRIKKKLEFVRKAYGPGDEVSATIKVNRPTGEPLANHPLTGVAMLDGEALSPVNATTNEQGGAIVKLTLPSRIEKGDGILTVMVQDGGITESISKRIPIVLKKLQFSSFPEGGHLVEGLESRLYFEAKNTIGKPADVEGEIIDDHGNAVARFRTHHFGLGRVAFTPSTGRSYKMRITKPVGVTETYPVPLAKTEGCVLRTYDDLDGQQPELRVSVACTEDRRMTVVGMLRENLLDAATLDVKSGTPAVAYLKAEDPMLASAMGVARVTLFDDQLSPMAERLVFRNRRNQLKVELKTDAEGYTPREQVALTVRTTDANGLPVPAEVAVAVVDDTVISFADDKTGHMLSRLLLEKEIADKVEEPNFFFDLTEAKSALAMDLLMGTRGYRRFDWKPVLNPPPPMPQSVATRGGLDKGGAMLDIVPQAMPGKVRRERRPRPRRKARRRARARAPAPPKPVALALPPAPAEPAPEPEPMAKMEEAKEMPAREVFAGRANKKAKAKADLRDLRGLRQAAKPAPFGGDAVAADEEVLADDMDWNQAAGEVAARIQAPGWAPVRVFPAPTYTGAFDGVRTDFRETIHWAPQVKTDAKGKAIVTFYLSDAITSFRIFAEGMGGNRVGRSEKVFKSSLPFSMSVKLPLEVSAGDEMDLPLTLTNEQGKALPLQLDASFGELLNLEKSVALEGNQIAANQRASLFYPVKVTGTQGQSKVRFKATAGGLSDEFVREVNVVPLGFPQTISDSGSVKDRMAITFDTGEALPGTAQARLTLYPSPVATLLSGIEGMIRQPYGCFEQTSSSNYPNVMVMDYLRTNDVADPDLVQRVQGVLDAGYKRLVGFETKQKGYEWFGQTPAHEALTAYGVLEFVDMKRVYGDVDQSMIDRTVKYLLSRRDGKGGFKRDGKALDSFGRAKPEVTNAYIIYSLTEAGYYDMGKEIEGQAKMAKDTDDPYLMALAVNTLLNVPAVKSAGMGAAKKLVSMQDKDGSWVGKDHSITRSTGFNLNVETTSLAVLALLKTGKHQGAVTKAVQWLTKNRRGHGAWGATQATVLALKALTQYAIASRRMKGSGTIKVEINGQIVAEQSYQSGRKEPIVFEGLGQHLTTGKNSFSIIHDGSGELPYSLAVDFRSTKPASHPDTVVGLETTIAKTELKMGETVRVTAKVTNRTDKGQPMTLARIGLPGGLTFQTWQLKELREKGLIAFYETRAREVILYFRDMKPSEVKEIPLELMATVPGRYTGPASRTYLYYTDDMKTWIDPLAVTIVP